MGVKYSEITSTVRNSVGTAVFVDFAQRPDGKILFGYVVSNAIYLKVLESEDVLNAPGNHCTGGTLFYTLGSAPRVQPFAILRLTNGRILMVINDTGVKPSVPWTIKVFISNSGTGEDFALRKVVYTQSRETGSFEAVFTPCFVAKPVQDKHGRIHISGSEAKIDSGYLLSVPTMYFSDDEFTTFTRTSNPFKAFTGVTGPHRITGVQNMTAIGDSVLLSYSYTYAEIENRFFWSTDRGQTWTQQWFLPSPGISPRPTDTLFSDPSGTVFRIAGTPPQTLYRKVFYGTPSLDEIKNLDSWETVTAGLEEYEDVGISRFLTMTDGGNLHEMSKRGPVSGSHTHYHIVLFRTKLPTTRRRFAQII